MKLGVLFSGGKDSCYALWLASQKEEVVCLISIISENKESYMFHTPNVNMTSMQAEAMELPLVSVKTPGEEEKELEQLREAIIKAREEYKIEGVVTGAVGSVYQASRVQKICDELELWCFNPLWQKDQVELLRDVVSAGFETIISGVFAEPFDDSWLGEKIDTKMIDKLIVVAEKYKINPAGEGGEIETTVMDAPSFKKRIKIKEATVEHEGFSGVFNVEKAVLVEK